VEIKTQPLTVRVTTCTHDRLPGRQQRKGCVNTSESTTARTTTMEALIVDLAEEIKQNTYMNKGPKPFRNSDLETPTSRMTGEERSMRENGTRPENELIAEIDYSKTQIKTSLLTMSCPSFTFEILCWSMELAKQIIDNHQRRRHTSVSDHCQVEGAQDEYVTIEAQVQNDGEE
jgi:hypothetical protein